MGDDNATPYKNVIRPQILVFAVVYNETKVPLRRNSSIMHRNSAFT
jgi:hypothetical protein